MRRRQVLIENAKDNDNFNFAEKTIKRVPPIQSEDLIKVAGKLGAPKKGRPRKKR